MTFPHLIEPLAVTGLVSAPAVISAARGRADTSASYQFLAVAQEKISVFTFRVTGLFASTLQ
jgi:hypothetical protein